jgi:predicted hydrocarbon binding protein
LNVSVYVFLIGRLFGLAEVAQTVNGTMLYDLGKAVGHEDLQCIEFFKFGAPAYGSLPVCGIGVPKATLEFKSIDDLKNNCEQSNRQLCRCCTKVSTVLKFTNRHLLKHRSVE